ncbi:MAG: 3-deoxy-D-manno-octulosonic acid kinase [Gammaproteobacteria bacterium]
MHLHEISEHNTKIWVPDHLRSDFQVNWFEAVSSQSIANEWQSGRQSIVRVNAAGRYMVRRHYCRGGVPARFSKDRFVFRGFKASRPFRELTLLLHMRRLDLPVPEPVAARCVVQGFLYHADILMSEISDSKTLAQLVSEARLEKEVWLKVGKKISQFHQQDIQHVDLNANNILIDKAGEVYLIDFDRCMQRAFSQSWAQLGLDRLKRSLDKQKLKHEGAHFHQSDFDSLMQGYRA